MLAFLYLCVCAITGMVLVSICVPDVRRLYLACAPSVKAIENIPSTLFVVSAGTVTGMLCVPFVNYNVILGLSYIVASDKLCMKISFMVTAALFLWLVLTCLMLVNKRRIRKEEEGESVTKLPQYVNKPSNTLFYSFSILLTTVVAAFLMFYTYRIDGGYLLNGYSTFSDLSPHTAMVSSFGRGFNFPSEYMHFSGDGIKYHFMFYFLAGMLEYLGFPIDYALNVPSIISMVCAMVLLGLLASLLSGRRLAFALSPILVFLRSSLNVFIHIGDLISKGQTPVGAITEIMSESSWYGTTPYDEWGVWAINVYPNQRHLMLGIAVVLICVILFIPFVRRLCISVMSAGSFSGVFKAILFSRNAWLPRKDDPLSAGTVALYSCILVIVMPYFHGSCLISLLLVLFGMALVSESRLLHLMVAICAVASSYIQTMVFSGGAQNVLSMAYNPGFLLSETSNPITSNVILSWGTYIVTVTGATLIAAELCTVILLIHDIIRKKPVYRFFLMLAFLNPMIFAFFFQVTREMLANHKFIQVSLILIDAFVALLLANLFVVPGRRKAALAVAAEDFDADAEDDVEEEEPEEETVDRKALEANIAKAEKEGELAPVTEEETKALEESVKKEPEEVHFGDDEGPFEVITDSDDASADLPEEIITDDEKAEDKKEEEKSEDKDSRLLSKIPDERTVSMRPGSVAIAEEAAKAEDAGKDTSSEAEVSDDSDDAEVAFKDEKASDAADKADESKEAKDSDSDIPAELTAGMRPGSAAITEEAAKSEDSEEKAEEKTDESSSEKSSDKNEPDSAKEETEDTDEMPFEVLAEDEEDKKEKSEDSEKSEEKALVKEETEEKKSDVKETDEKESDDDKSDEEDDDEDDEPEMVLEHAAIEPAKAKGLPGPVWVIFEIFGVLAALILLVALVGTGISEWATYININSTPMAVNVNSPVTEWIEKNTEPNDVFLTPEWSMNRFLLAGRPMYYGWPYYAWSAGHDTNTRDTIYLWLISGCGGDIKEFKRYCKERGIRYLIADPDFEDGDYGEDVFFNREFFEQNLQQVAYFTEEQTVIYKIY